MDHSEGGRSGPWDLHYDPESCKLRRSFGAGDEQIFIELTKFGPGEKFQLIMLGKPLSSTIKIGIYKITFGILPPYKWASSMAATGNDGTDVAVLNLPDFAPIDPKVVFKYVRKNLPPPTIVTPAQRATIRTITISTVIDDTFVLKTGPLGPPLAALDKCLDELVRSWGVDPSVPLKTPPMPKSDPSKWLSSKDYPKAALQQRKIGIVYFRLSVDQTGAVTQCSVQRAFNESDFAQTTCQLLSKRAQFEPAQDLSGQPVVGYFRSSVRFWVPPKH